MPLHDELTAEADAIRFALLIDNLKQDRVNA